MAHHVVFTNLANARIGTIKHPRHDRLFLYLIKHRSPEDCLESIHRMIETEFQGWKWPQQSSANHMVSACVICTSSSGHSASGCTPTQMFVKGNSVSFEAGYSTFGRSDHSTSSHVCHQFLITGPWFYWLCSYSHMYQCFRDWKYFFFFLAFLKSSLFQAKCPQFLNYSSNNWIESFFTIQFS